MELEKVTAEIRPRSEWEAVDLGLSLTRNRAGILFKAWMGSVYPTALVILLVFWSSPVWGIFLLWWLKPIWERVALYPLSRSLFGENPRFRDSVRVLPQELVKQKWLALLGVGMAVWGAYAHGANDNESVPFFWLVLFGLLFVRSGFMRSFVGPVRYLEGLEGDRFKARIRLLLGRASGTALLLTALCAVTEVLVFFSQVIFLTQILPASLSDQFMQSWDDFFSGDHDLLAGWLGLVFGVVYLNAMTFVAWFYTGSGFGLYLNTRTLTEGWDIELNFKRLAQRLGVMVFCCGIFLGPSELQANERAERVLQEEEFRVKTDPVYQKEDRKRRSSGISLGGGGIFAGVGQLIFWVVVACAVAGLVWLIVSNAHLFRRGGISKPERERQRIKTVAGLNIDEESLPQDLLGTARRWWNEGRHQEALSLMYRGALAYFLARRLVEIEESDTEAECLQRVRAKGSAVNGEYFQRLTGAWMNQAYAQRTPDDDVVSALFSEWPYQERRGR